MWDLVQSRLMASFRGHPAVRAALPDTLAAVGGQREAATAAARRLLELHASAPPAPPPDPAGVAPADPAAPRTDPRV
jgi:hypothetical protein